LQLGKERNCCSASPVRLVSKLRPGPEGQPLPRLRLLEGCEVKRSAGSAKRSLATALPNRARGISTVGRSRVGEDPTAPQAPSRSRIRPKKALSQCFLKSSSIREKILSAVDASAEDVVVEIGAGTGALTTGLARKAGQVLAVEVDPDLRPVLEKAVRSFSNVSILWRSVLSLDLRQVAVDCGRDRIVLVGNLPYHLTTRVILHLMEHQDVIRQATIMVQKEYGDRLLASPGGRDYGAITLRTTYNAKATRVTDVPSSAFHPRPKVDSTVITLDFRESPAVQVADEVFMFRLIRETFSHRRKMLVNSLSRLSDLPKKDVKRICLSVGIDAERRPETLSLEEFARLADAFSSIQ
jgi:16S rRNA (adenine1518-N6/adenine1519-N6)-dimethyltransferase